MHQPSSRREFLGQVALSASVAALADAVLAGQSPAGATGIPTRVLGCTGQRVSIDTVMRDALATAIADERRPDLKLALEARDAEQPLQSTARR